MLSGAAPAGGGPQLPSGLLSRGFYFCDLHRCNSAFFLAHDPSMQTYSMGVGNSGPSHGASMRRDVAPVSSVTREVSEFPFSEGRMVYPISCVTSFFHGIRSECRDQRGFFDPVLCHSGLNLCSVVDYLLPEGSFLREV